MKSFFATLTLSLVLLNYTSGQAARVLTDGPVHVLATEQTRQMVKYLQFNEFEYIKIRKIIQLRIQEELEAKANYADDAPLLAKKLKTIEMQYDNAVLELLTDKQKIAFTEFRKNTSKPTLASNQ